MASRSQLRTYGVGGETVIGTAGDDTLITMLISGDHHDLTHFRF